MIMSNKYDKLDGTELTKAWEKHQKIIKEFIKDYFEEGKGRIKINKKIVLEIINKVDQRKKYFKYFHDIDMSDFKEVALISFWYIKLKPIFVESDDAVYDTINEKLAFYFIIHTLTSLLRKNELPLDKVENLNKVYVKEVIYSFVYRDISKEALILLVESIAVFLGLNPYQEETVLKK